MTPQEFLDEFGTLAESAEGVPKLRELILELAVRGKLVEQDDADEPAAVLLERIRAERERQIAEKIIRRGKALPTRKDGELGFDIPSTWEWAQFGEFGDWGAGATPRRGESTYYGGETVWLKSGELNNGVVTESEEKVTAKALKDCSLRLNQPGDVLIAMYGATIGKLAIAGVECTTNQAVCACTCFDGVYNRFLFLLLRAFKDFFIKKSSGAAQPNYSKEKIVRTSAPLPPLREQHRIVSKVDELMGLCDRLEAVQGERRGVRVRLNRSSLDRLTSASTARGGALSAAWQRVCDHFEVLYDTPETLPDLRQTILQLAVQGKLVPQDPNDEPADELLVRIANTRASLVKQKRLKKSKALPSVDDGEIEHLVPSSWSWTRLGECCLNITDGFHNTPKTTDNGVPYLMAKHVKPHRLDFSERLFVSESDHQELVSKTRPKRGDVLVVNIGAGCGTPAVIDVDFEFSFKNVAILNRTDEVDPEYLFTFLMATRAATFDALTQGGAQPFLSLTRLRSKPFPLPPLSEQKRIVSKVTHLLSQVTRLESTLTRRESTRTQLLTAAIHAILRGTK